MAISSMAIVPNLFTQMLEIFLRKIKQLTSLTEMKHKVEKKKTERNLGNRISTEALDGNINSPVQPRRKHITYQFSKKTF